MAPNGGWSFWTTPRGPYSAFAWWVRRSTEGSACILDMLPGSRGRTLWLRRHNRRHRWPAAKQDALVQPADRDQHQAEADERQRPVDACQRRHVDQERFRDGQRDHDGRGQPRALRVDKDADAEQ